MTDLEHLERLLAAPTPDDELLRALREAAPELIRNVREARSLLAVIHRDGGHHTARVGFAQSAHDAREIVYVMLAAMDTGTEP